MKRMVNGKKNVMKNKIIVSILAILAVCGCQVKELNEVISESKSFTASIEDNFNGGNTRTSLDDQGNVLFKKGDQISIFIGSTINEQFQVTDDSDGKTSASLIKVTGSGFVAGGEIESNVAFYPYASATTIAKNEGNYVLGDITLPSVQYYAEDSFGNGAFPMAAVTNDTDDMHLKFKNVLGGLKLQLTGTATITSITVSGNNNEILCGAAEVTVSNSTTPSINLTDATAKTVTLDCGEGVQLNSETATLFILALPPMTMESGFTVVVTDTEGKQMRIKSTKSQTINRSKLLKMPAVVYEAVPVIQNPLTFTSTGETSISLVKEGNPDDVSLEYNKNGGAWIAYSVGDVIALADGEKVSFRAGAMANTSFGKSLDDYHHFAISGKGRVAASGSIMSILDQEESAAIQSSYCFFSLFRGCTTLTSAAVLPATVLTDNCYCEMFYGCTSLTSAPDLPATTLADYCYCGMFKGCTSLTSAPALPTTTLAHSCYGYMFSDCTSLTTAPELPATSLAHFCYQYMFSGCTSLTIASGLPATTLAGYCYFGMFSGCTSLTSAPKLPATSLAASCYYRMFKGCSNLNYIKCLATDLSADSCLFSWVDGVSSNGVFIKDPDTTWPTGNSGIPEGWTVYPTGLPAEVEAVDLGLSVKWANMNVGATSPEEYGGYFAWGETEPKEDYSEDNYKWCNGNLLSLTKYNTGTNYGTVDNKTVLDLEDDAAHANWGGSWRMPTREEFAELNINCTSVWTTENNVKGRRFTSKKEGYTDKSIFIPAPGWHYQLGDYLPDRNYWSSSLNTVNPNGAIVFWSASNGVSVNSASNRCEGLPIRPVCD